MSFRIKVILFLLFVVLLSANTFAVDEITPLDRARTHLQREGEIDKAKEILTQYKKDNPNDVQAYLLESQIFLKENRTEDAKSSLENALKISPDNSEVLLSLARICYDLGKDNDALGYYQLLIQKGEDSEEIYQQLALLQIRQGKYDLAAGAARDAIIKQPENFKNYVLLAQIQEMQGKQADAAQSYETALQKGCKDKDVYYKLAEIYEETAELAKAIDANQRIIKEFKEEIAPYRSLSRLYRLKGDLWLSIGAWISFVFDGMPVNQIVGFFLGFGLFVLIVFYGFRVFNSFLLLPLVLIAGGLQNVYWLEQLSGVSSLYALDIITYLCNYEITIIDPEKADAWKNIAAFYEKREQFELASESYEKAVKLEPNLPDVWYSLGMLHHKQKEYKEAEIAFKKALQYDDDNFVYWYHLAYAYFEQEAYNDAADAAKHALDLSIDFSPSLDIFVEACEWSGQLEKCEDVILDLLKKRQKNLRFNMESGNLLLLEGRAKESLQYFEEAIELSPESYETWYNFGVAQREAGLFDNAAVSIEKALELSPDSAWILTSYGLTLLMGKKKKEGERILRKSLEKDSRAYYSNHLLGIALLKKNSDEAKRHLKIAIENFEKDTKKTKKPWQKANEFQCLGIACQAVGMPEKAIVAFDNAIKFAKVTPEKIRIFSEDQMKLVSPGEFDKECQDKIDKIKSEAGHESSDKSAGEPSNERTGDSEPPPPGDGEIS